VRRPVDVRLGGLWEFPGTVRSSGETNAEAAARAARDAVGIEVRALDAVATVKHTFSHLKASYHALRCELVSGEPRALRCDGFAWAAPGEIDRYALPVAQQKIARLAAEWTLFSG
jgi:mutator protein MutT